jgi:NMD protein affecting ribosome stability and mRNA decay
MPYKTVTCERCGVEFELYEEEGWSGAGRSFNGLCDECDRARGEGEAADLEGARQEYLEQYGRPAPKHMSKRLINDLLDAAAKRSAKTLPQD